jgi:hypothetical protein
MVTTPDGHTAHTTANALLCSRGEANPSIVRGGVALVVAAVGLQRARVLRPSTFRCSWGRLDDALDGLRPAGPPASRSFANARRNAASALSPVPQLHSSSTWVGSSRGVCSGSRVMSNWRRHDPRSNDHAPGEPYRRDADRQEKGAYYGGPSRRIP